MTFTQLQALWYGKLRAGGFVDIEGGKDLNRYDASTFETGGSTAGVVKAVPFDFSGSGDVPDDWHPSTLAEHPRARYDSIVNHALGKMRDRHAAKRLRTYYTFGVGSAEGRAIASSYMTARREWAAFLHSLGLPGTRPAKRRA